jgi:hypothetical protein
MIITSCMDRRAVIKAVLALSSLLITMQDCEAADLGKTQKIKPETTGPMIVLYAA